MLVASAVSSPLLSVVCEAAEVRETALALLSDSSLHFGMLGMDTLAPAMADWYKCSEAACLCFAVAASTTDQGVCKSVAEGCECSRMLLQMARGFGPAVCRWVEPDMNYRCTQ